MSKTLNELLAFCFENNASDLHINVNRPAQMRVDGTLVSIGEDNLTPEKAKAICFECLSDEQTAELEKSKSIDLSFEIKGLSRYRANIFTAQACICGAFRTIPFEIKMPAELGIPERVIELTHKPRGLILVTGQTGSGKSTTLASLIETVNRSRHEHIITVEDPIEFIFEQKKSLINQREVGRDTLSFVRALKYILRQDPDIVLIGEMRDLETVQSAITIAETGHLVMGTLHTNSAVQTIDRIIDVFPPHHQSQIRTQLSFILEGVLSQQLLPKVNGGRVLSLEVLYPTVGIRNLIREGKTHQIPSQMQMGQQNTGMITMDQSLAELANSGLVSKEVARHRSLDVNEFDNYAR